MDCKAAFGASVAQSGYEIKKMNGIDRRDRNVIMQASPKSRGLFEQWCVAHSAQRVALDGLCIFQ